MNIELIYLIAFLLVGFILFYLLNESCRCNKVLEGNSELEGLPPCKGEYKGDACVDGDGSGVTCFQGDGFSCSDQVKGGKCFQCTSDDGPDKKCKGKQCKNTTPPISKLPQGYCTGYPAQTATTKKQFCISNNLQCNYTNKYGDCDNGICTACTQSEIGETCENGNQCKKPPTYCGQPCTDKGDCSGDCSACLDNPDKNIPKGVGYDKICGTKNVDRLPGYCADNWGNKCPSGFSPLPYARCEGEKCNASNCCVENLVHNCPSGKYLATDFNCYPKCEDGDKPCDNYKVSGFPVNKPANCVYLENEDIGRGCSDGTSYGAFVGFQGNFEDLNGKPEIKNVFCQQGSQIVSHIWPESYKCKKNSRNVNVFKTLQEFKDMVNKIPHLKDHPKLFKLLETHFPKTFKNLLEVESFINNL